MNIVEKRRLALAQKCVNFGKYEYAELVMAKMQQDGSKSSEIYKEFAILFVKMDKLDKAIEAAQKAFETDKCVDTLKLLASTNFICDKYEDAAIQFEELLKYNPDESTYKYCIDSYKNLGLEEEAIRINKQFIENSPSANSYASLFFLYAEIGMTDEAIACCDEMKKKFPNHSLTYSSFGFLNETIYNDYEKAKEFFLKAAKRGFIDSYYNLGVCCKQSEDFENAEKYLKKLISLKAETTTDYNYTLGTVYFAQRKLRLGYKYYLNRKNTSLLNKKDKKQQWDGKDYPEETLLVMREQGLGDNIQFSRFLPIVAKKFKKVVYLIEESLCDILRRSYAQYDNIEIIPRGSTVRYNKFVLLMDIPYVLHMSYQNIPQHRPYLIADNNKIEQYKEKYFKNDDFKIGLCWRASGMGLRDAVYRTIDGPYYYRKLFDIPNTKFYSFQTQDIFNMLEKYPQMTDLSPEFSSFDETASLIKNLDVLVTVDTAIAHLAGGLGIKTYLLLCHAPDWRWFENTEKTEWYDSVTIIKQSDRRTWEDVSEKLLEYITNDVKNHSKK